VTPPPGYVLIRPETLVALQKAAHRHQHQAHRAVAADVVLDAFLQRRIDHGHVDRVENDHCVVVHAKRAGGVDPVALPARLAQLRIDVVRVVAALARDDHRQRLQALHAHRVAHRRRVAPDRRTLAAGLRSGEEHRLDMVEVALLAHALHEHRPHHTAPADDADSKHVRSL